MIGENRQFVTNEPVEFEKYPVEVQDCRKTTDHLRGIYRIYPNLRKENRRMSTCNRPDLQTRGSQPIMLKNLPDHWSGHPTGIYIYILKAHMNKHTPLNNILECPHVRTQVIKPEDQCNSMTNKHRNFCISFHFETEGQQTNAKAHETIDHLTSSPSRREKISHPGIKPPTSSLRFGYYLSTIIR
jgi:hypothetical protein